MLHLLLVLIATVALRVAPSDAACGPVSAAFCTSSQGGTCFIDGQDCPVVGDSTLDFGIQSVVLRQGTRLDVGAGTMTILAGSLELQSGTALLGHGGSIIVQTTGPVVVRGSARIDVADPVAADRIQITSTTGTIHVEKDGSLNASGTNNDGSGGSIDVSGASIVGSGDILASGGNLGVGGGISLDAKTAGIFLSGTIEALGGSGGALDLAAEGPITTTGRIDIRATAAGGDGGFFSVTTIDGSVAIGGKVFMQGDEGTDLDGGANGGELNVFSAAALLLTGEFEVSGAPPDGQGGDVFFMSMLDTVQTGIIQAQGRGAESDGGSVEYDAHRDLLLGPIDLHGGENLPDSGGALQAAAWCNLTVPAGKIIDAQGDRGSLLFQAGGALTASGSFKAGSPVLLEYLTTPPLTGGGTFLPEVVIGQNPALTPCGGFAPPTCGNGTLDTGDGEECDDSDTMPCDGCSSTCQQEACGNDRVDCGETCDDGNTASGDTCHGDCSRLDNVCGDGLTDTFEGCDDGDAESCDGCSSTCQIEGCGNGAIECLEECDTPGVGGCSADCSLFVPPGCGNGAAVDPEQCDDGNSTDGDGCSHQCRLEVCGNGTKDPGEDCDDFNVVGCDSCSPTCKPEGCGNGVLDCGEECDDGDLNGAPGGSCLPEECRPGSTCSTGGEEPCIPCATTIDCSPLGLCGSEACDAGICTPISPPVCNDLDACNGVETCAPAVGCTVGAAPVCDDGDACTVDSCDSTLGCEAERLPGFGFLKCRLAAARDVVVNAPGADIDARTRGKLLKKLTGVETKVLAAEAGTRASKVRRALKAASKQIGGAVRFVTKQRGKKIADATATAILDALAVLPPIVSGLVP